MQLSCISFNPGYPSSERYFLLFNSMSSPRSGKFTNCILIQSRLIHCILFTTAFEPFHWDKLFWLIGIISIIMVKIFMLKHIHCNFFTSHFHVQIWLDAYQNIYVMLLTAKRIKSIWTVFCKLLIDKKPSTRSGPPWGQGKNVRLWNLFKISQKSASVPLLSFSSQYHLLYLM